MYLERPPDPKPARCPNCRSIIERRRGRVIFDFVNKYEGRKIPAGASQLEIYRHEKRLKRQQNRGERRRRKEAQAATAASAKGGQIMTEIRNDTTSPTLERGNAALLRASVRDGGSSSGHAYGQMGVRSSSYRTTSIPGRSRLRRIVSDSSSE